MQGLCRHPGLLRRCLGQLLDLGPQVRAAGRLGDQADPVQALHRQLDGAVGQLEHVLDPNHRSDVMDVVPGGLLDVLVELRGHGHQAVAGGQVVEQLQGAGPPHRQRDQHVREHDGVLQGQHRERLAFSGHPRSLPQPCTITLVKSCLKSEVSASGRADCL